MIVTAEITGRDKLLAAFLAMPEKVSKNLRVALKNSLEKVAIEAGSRHRFISRGDFAAKSPTVDVANNGFSGRVYLNDGIAYYAKYLHKGWHTRKGKPVRGWNADRFLYEAWARNVGNTIGELSNAITKSIKDAGLK